MDEPANEKLHISHISGNESLLDDVKLMWKTFKQSASTVHRRFQTVFPGHDILETQTGFAEKTCHREN